MIMLFIIVVKLLDYWLMNLNRLKNINYFMAAILAAILYFSKQPGIKHIFNSNVFSNRINIKKLTVYT